MMFPFFKYAVSNLFSKPSTENFPAEDVDAKPNYRGAVSYDAEKCVNCGMCIKVCSPSSITRTVEDVEGGQRITYHFDYTSCTFCGMCQDFCTSKAIKLTEDYHMVGDAKDLFTEGTRFKPTVKGKLACDKDTCIYCGLCAKNCPEEAITVDRKEKTWTVDHDKCSTCGTCIAKCPKKSLSFAEPAEEGVLWSDSCIYCTICAKKCPCEAITVDRKEKTWKIDRDLCTLCGTCVGACPKKSLSIGEITEDAKKLLEKAAAPAAEAPAETAPAAEAPAEAKEE